MRYFRNGLYPEVYLHLCVYVVEEGERALELLSFNDLFFFYNTLIKFWEITMGSNKILYYIKYLVMNH